MRIRIAAPAHRCQAEVALLALVVVCAAPSFSSAAFAQSVAPTFRSASPEQEPMKPAGLKAGTTQATRASASVTPTHYNIDVAFEPEKHFLRATAAVTLRVNEQTSAIEFELNRHLALRSVTDAQGRSLEFIRSGRLNSHKLLVLFADPIDPATTPECSPVWSSIRLTARFKDNEIEEPKVESSEDPVTGHCIVLTFIYEGILPSAYLDYVNEGGILLRDESRWYPSTDLSAFTTNVVKVQMPSSDWKVVTSGGWVEPPEDDNPIQIYFTTGPVSSRALAVYAVDSPNSCREFMQLKLENPTVTYCQPKGLKQPFEKLARKTLDILETFSEELGPRDNRSSVSDQGFEIGLGFPGQQGVIGYSAPGFLVVSEDVVKWHGYPGFAPGFLPHEVAHQWFPIEVTLASEEDGWLAEGLAEYLAWRYLEEKQPDDARRMVELAMRNTLAYEPARPLRLGLKLFALEDWDVTHATLYQRGMLVWRTLETVIDRERVDAALREYYRRHRGGSASIADFRKICEEISGRDLGWFFDYYINGTQLPEISLRRLPSAAPNELAGEIVVRNAPPEFQVRVELRITTAGGVIDHSVATRGEVTPFAIDVRDAVTAVELDPRLRILRVTEPARRHRAQRMKSLETNLTESASSDAGELRALVNVYQSAADLDPENLAANHQLYALKIGRLHFRLKEYDAAHNSLDRALVLESLDPMATDLQRAWARVYRAHIALARGDKAAARREAEAGLAMKCPALDTKIAWPDAPEKETTAAEAVRAILARL